MDYVLDIQGFQCPENRFVCKELAYIPLYTDSFPNVLFFKPPYHWIKLPIMYKSVNRWIEIYHHGMLWSSGMIPYKMLSNVLQNHLYSARNIYIKGLEKKQWLQKILPEKKILDLESEMRCPPLNELSNILQTPCAFHLQKQAEFVCAVTNIQKLKTWIEERLQYSIPEGSDTVDHRTESDCNLYKNSSEYFDIAMSTTEHKDYRQSVLYSMYN